MIAWMSTSHRLRDNGGVNAWLRPSRVLVRKPYLHCLLGMLADSQNCGRLRHRERREYGHSNHDTMSPNGRVQAGVRWARNWLPLMEWRGQLPERAARNGGVLQREVEVGSGRLDYVALANQPHVWVTQTTVCIEIPDSL